MKRFSKLKFAANTCPYESRASGLSGKGGCTSCPSIHTLLGGSL